MKKILSFLLLGFLLSIGYAWGEDVTILNCDCESTTGWTLSGKTSSASNKIGTGKSLQIASGKGAGSAQTPAFASLQGTTATLTFKHLSSSGSSNRTFKVTGNSCKVDGQSYVELTAKTSVGSSTIAITEASTSSSITFSAESGQGTIIDDIIITYSTGASTNPSISASNVDLAYDATNGSISFTVNNGVEGGVTTAATTSEWLTVGSLSEGAFPLTCAANEGEQRTATVTLTYTYNSTETVTKDVTITQAAAPVIYSTITSLFNAATSTETDVLVTFNNWVVSGVSTNGKNVFVTDGINGFVIYYNSDMSETYSVNDILSGTAVSCKLKLYNGFAELLNVNASDLTITEGGSVSVASTAMAELTGIHTGSLLNYENLTCSVSNNKYYLSDGTTTLQVYNTLYAFDALEDGKNYNITGIYQQYNSTKEILPRSADDIEEVAAPAVPSITLSNNSIEATAEATNGTITVTYDNITDIEADIVFFEADGITLATDDPNWVVAEINNSNNVEYLIDANTGDARTAYMKVYALDDNAEDVYSELITISQAAYVAPVPSTTFTLVKSINDIVPGAHYIIASGTDEDVKVMGIQNSNNRAAVAATAVATVESSTITITNESIREFIICKDGENANGDDTYVIFDEEQGDKGSYLYAGSNSSNHLKSEETLDKNNNGKWAIEFNGDIASIVAQGTNARNVMQYNSGSKLFSCYGSASQSDVYLYMKDDENLENVEITISNVGYATLYYGEKNLIVPEGVTAYVFNTTDNLVEAYVAGEVIPQGTGVVLNGNTATYDFVETAVPGTAPAKDKNQLLGSDEAAMTTGGSVYYALSLDQNDENVGFYYMAENGAAFENGAHKAYLALGASQAPARFYIFNGENTTTNIENLNGNENAVKFIENGKLFILRDGVVYDAMGKMVR